MTPARFWPALSWTLFAAWLSAAVLGMRGVHAGFVTNYLADLTQPAWLYVSCRGLGPRSQRVRWLSLTMGRTPARAALLLFTASTLTEVSQYFWPRGPFRGRWDPLDIVAYGVGIGLCYSAERWWLPASPPVAPPEHGYR